jgi:hypothetical protein
MFVSVDTNVSGRLSKIKTKLKRMYTVLGERLKVMYRPDRYKHPKRRMSVLSRGYVYLLHAFSWLVSDPEHWLVDDESLTRTVHTRGGTVLNDNWFPWNQFLSAGELRQKQKRDTDLKPLFKWFTQGRPPDKHESCALSPTTRHYLLGWEQLEVIQGVLFRNKRQSR